MKCPFCKADNDQVLDSRTSDEGACIRRRRKCNACKLRFTTYERVEESQLMVIKKGGENRVPYRRDKILYGIQIACNGLNITQAQMDEQVLKVEQKIFKIGVREVQSSLIGECVMEVLRELNQVAYVRFASVYKEFKDVEAFMNVLNEFMRGSSTADTKELPKPKANGRKSTTAHAIPPKNAPSKPAKSAKSKESRTTRIQSKNRPSDDSEQLV